MNKIEEALKELFKDFSIRNCKEVSIKEGFFCIDDTFFVNEDFFVRNIFFKGSKWAENLYSKIFQRNPQSVSVRESINVKDAICVDVEGFPMAIIAVLKEKQESVALSEEDSKKAEPEESSFIIKLMRQKLPLSFIASIGSSSEIFLDESKVNCYVEKNGKKIYEMQLQEEDGKIILKVKK